MSNICPEIVKKLFFLKVKTSFKKGKILARLCIDSATPFHFGKSSSKCISKIPSPGNL